MQQYIMHAWDSTGEDALERRMKVRPSHFESARKLKENGNFVFAGAILNDEEKMIGSMMVVQFETKEQLQHWLDTEPYISEKVWERMDLRPFRTATI